MTIEAEQAVLGGAMLQPGAFWKVADLISAADFQVAGHAAIFKAMRHLVDADQPIDAITLGNYINNAHLTQQAGDPSYLIGLVANTPSAVNIQPRAKSSGRGHRRRG